MSTILLPKTQHLVVFQEVIRSGSIGSAAKELGLTQPAVGNDSNLLIVFYVQIMPDDFVMQLHRF